MRWMSILAVCFVFSCSNKPDAPDVSGIKTNITVHRFDKDFFSIDTTQLQPSLSALEKKYPAFLSLYFKFFAPVKEIAMEQGIAFDSALLIYFRFIQPLYKAAATRFASTTEIEKALETNLRYVKHYFPSFKLPVALTSVESLNPQNPMEIYGTTFYRDTLIISLQMFLGKDYPAYDPQQYPDYIRRRFEPQYVVPNSFRAIAADLYADSSESASLIERMIEKGKQWWLMKKFMPEVADSLITGYTGAQMQALDREEGNIWGHINQNENLFSIEPITIQNYIGEAPFTQTLPQGAPGNIGPWIGWRIISTFEERNSKLTVDQILHTTAKKIFEEAKYKPK